MVRPRPAILFAAFFVLLSFHAAAYAQDDDTFDQTTFDDSTVQFTAPDAIEANTTYTFVFEVFNAAMEQPNGEKQPWILQVDLTMPEDYLLADDAEQPDPPACLHQDQYCDHWEAAFDPATPKVTWHSFGTASSVEYGDIREQDVQTFSFVATTDAGPAVNFAWMLTADDGSVVEGGGGDPHYDDDTDTDDDTDEQSYDDDDDDGCGC